MEVTINKTKVRFPEGKDVTIVLDVKADHYMDRSVAGFKVTQLGKKTATLEWELEGKTCRKAADIKGIIRNWMVVDLGITLRLVLFVIDKELCDRNPWMMPVKVREAEAPNVGVEKVDKSRWVAPKNFLEGLAYVRSL